MSSRKLQQYNEFDNTLGRDLQKWGALQQPPAGLRTQLLEKAAGHAGDTRAKSILQRLPKWLTRTVVLQDQPRLQYTELSQWLYTQAMTHSLNIDRRAVRFVS